MTWTPGKAKWDWRSFLSEDEIEAVKSIDKAISVTRGYASESAKLLAPIRNRAIQRARTAAARRDREQGDK